MTTNEAIKQLDWYFNEDDGGASDDKTKQAYATLKKNYTSLRSTAFAYRDSAIENVKLTDCPSCKGKLLWKGFVSRYTCANCGWEGDAYQE